MVFAVCHFLLFGRSLLFVFADLADPYEQGRVSEYADQRGDQHTAEESETHDVACDGIAARSEDQRNYAHQEGECRHNDGAHPQTGAFDRRIPERKTLVEFCFGIFDDQDRILGRPTRSA